VTFGTVLGHMTIASEVYTAVLEAVSHLEVRVLLTVGRSFDPTSLGAIPTNVHVEPWVDQNTILEEADAVVCHGGSGTTFGAMRTGLPVVVIPLFADQNANGVKVVESGSGIVVDLRPREPGRSPVGRDDGPRIANAIRNALSDPTYRRCARRVSKAMTVAPAAREVLRDLLDAASSQ
jgi:UDP:flavonoid glycosyltransferase YjiC (YdhE family)